jgi:glycosyltransferase involved in cell wall biosynthesis
MISILILTLNEEVNVAACIQSVTTLTDDVVVLDSFSTDQTVPIARANSATVVQRKFDNWAAHQNWAMTEIPFKYPWVFYLDADERMTPELADEIKAIASNPLEKRVAFYCGRKNYFMGRWIRHAMPPGLIMRFFRPQKIRFERLVNPTPVISGPHGYLRHHFLHYNFSKGLAEWFTKHNRYSTFEAMEGVKARREGSFIGQIRATRNADDALRRKAMKNLSFRLPLRALARFMLVYFVKNGFLDGLAGFHYSIMISMYEYWIALKMQELQNDWAAENERIAKRLLEQSS